MWHGLYLCGGKVESGCLNVVFWSAFCRWAFWQGVDVVGWERLVWGKGSVLRGGMAVLAVMNTSFCGFGCIYVLA